MSEPTTITLRSWYPYQLAIDPDDEGHPRSIALRITAFTKAERQAYEKARAPIMNPPSELTLARKPDGDEQEKTTRTIGGRDREVFLLDDAAIRARRLADLSEDERARLRQQEDAEAERDWQFVVDTITQYVRIAPGQRISCLDEDDHATAVTNGAELVQALREHPVYLQQLALAVWAENTLTGDLKNGWRSRSASKRSSTAPETTAAGERPAPIVALAEPEASAALAGATV